jgi:hypothetical protein
MAQNDEDARSTFSLQMIGYIGQNVFKGDIKFDT